MLKIKPLFFTLVTGLLLCSAFPAFAQVTSERVDNPQLSQPQSGVEKSARTSVPTPEPRVQKASGPRSLRERSLARKLSRETAQDTQRLEAEPCEGFRSVSEIDRTGLIDDRFLDLNNDKRTDLAAIRDNRLTIWLAGVSGALGSPVDYPIEGAVIEEFQNNDINSDGISDFIVKYSIDGQKALRVYLNQGNGLFAVTAEVSTNDHSLNFFEDLNGDTRKDLVAIRNDRLTIWLTNASGGLGTPTDYLVGGINSRLYVRRDLNNDGRFDFTIENSQQGQLRITIFRNNGDGTISLLQTLNPIINAPGDGNSFFGLFENAYSGDFDGDGFRDYFFTNYINKTSFSGRRLKSYDQSRMFYNNGDGTFKQDTFFVPVSFSFIALEPSIGDINGDQFTDIVAATIGFSPFSINISTFLGDPFRFLRTNQSNADFFVGSAPPFATGQPRILLFSNGVGAELGYDNGVGTFGFIAFSHADGFFRRERPVLPPRPPTPGPDLNGDGIPDRIQQDFVSTSYVITIEFGNADGTFRQVFTGPVAQFASYKVLEFNADGIKDLGWLTGQTYNIILSQPDGSYTGPLSFDLGTGIQQSFDAVTELDFNGDNKVDLLVRRTTPNVFSILINDCLGGSVSINQPPTITAGAALTRQAGSTGTTATIATVSDTETPVGNLTLAATTVPAGISVTGIQNTNGTITATVSAACGATAGANTVVLTVTDGNGATATANLTINVTGNAPPTLGSYSSTTVGLGASVTVTPTAPPAADGSAPGVTVTSSPGFTGSLSVNAITGAVTITNAGAIGTHTITVTAADTCGNQASASFSLIVRQSATTTTLTSSSAALVYGQSVTFTAMVNSADGIPAGAVTFIVAGIQQGAPVSLVGGKATLTLNTLNAGTHSIRANYSGAVAFEASSSSVLAQDVAKANVVIRLKSLTTSRLLSVSITAQPVLGVGTPTGTVQILVNNVLRDRRTLVNGSVQSVITRPDGRATVVVKYSGDENFNPAQAFITVQ